MGLSEIINRLKNGEIVFMPSDTMYGLSCIALNENAVSKIYKLKGRSSTKPFVILLADIHQAESLGLQTEDFEPVRRIWPAPLTLIVPASTHTPEFLHRGTHSLAVRVPKKPELIKLIKETGPLVSTSANPAGKPPAEDTNEAREYFGDGVDFYVDEGKLSNYPSTIVKYKDDQLEIMRQGTYQIDTQN